MRFTIEDRQWYAAQIMGDEFSPKVHYEPIFTDSDYTPIYIDGIRPLGKGNRRFELRFFHMTYPVGVQGKVYQLETLERGHNFILAKSVDHDPTRILHIYTITWEWLEKHFSGWLKNNSWDKRQPGDIKDFLNRNAGD
jgi:hypothetical protein